MEDLNQDTRAPEETEVMELTEEQELAQMQAEEDALEGGSEDKVDPALAEQMPLEDAPLAEAAIPAATKKKAKAPTVVDYKLEQSDDEPRDDLFPALTVPGIRELNASGQNWEDSFDPQTGILPTPKEKATTAVPSKMFVCEPDIKGSKAAPKPVLINGVQQYKPTASLRTFPVAYDEEMVQEALGGVFGDAVSKYVLDQFLKPFNKLVQNDHYGRKMPIRTFNAPFKLSLAGIAETSGVTFEEHLLSLLRAGWYRKSASVRQFEMSVMCDTPEQLAAILAQKGKMIMEWKPADFVSMMGTAATFKRVGKIISDNFTYKGRAPASAQLFAVLDCVNLHTKPYTDKLEAIEEAEQEVEAGNLPAEAITPAVLTLKEGCIEQLGHWSAVSCGVDGLAQELAKAEAKKLAQVSKDEDDLLENSLESLVGLDDLSFVSL